MTAQRIILASSSPYRRELLARLGLPFEWIAPPFDEESAKGALSGAPPEEIVRSLALGKARAVSAMDPNAIVIGSDQAVEIDGELLGKPGTEPAACAELTRLAGHTHRLLTAVALIKGEQVLEVLDVHRLTMRPLSQIAIVDYVRRDSPLDCAGAYKIESLGISLFEKIEGNDFTAIIGLPLTRVTAMLEQMGVAVLGGRD